MDTTPDSALSRLLSPVRPDDFFDDHWERRPLHVGRADEARFAGLVSVAGIEAALSRGALRHPEVQLTRAGSPVPAADCADEGGRLLADRVARHHAEGATIVLSRADRTFDALATLVRELQRELGWRCQANAYLSPPGNRGFAAHHDTHDVFVLQVAGTKTFRFYTGGPELPFCDERYDPATAGPREGSGGVELSPGDTLYIPRGIVHDALAHEGAASLHVTLGVFPTVLRDVLMEAVQVAAERDVALRRSVTPAAWHGAGDAEDAWVRDAMLAIGIGTAEAGPREVMREVMREAMREALSRRRDEAAIANGVDAAGALAPGTDGSVPDDATGLVVNAAVTLERRGDRLRVRRPGAVMELGEPLAAAVQALVDAGGARVAELHGLDAGRRIALARRLLDEGVCRIVREGSAERA